MSFAALTYLMLCSAAVCGSLCVAMSETASDGLSGSMHYMYARTILQVDEIYGSCFLFYPSCLAATPHRLAFQ